MIALIKNNRKMVFPGLGNENGSAIVIAVMVLLAVTIMGIASSNNSVIELFVTGNDVVKKISFFNADSGIFVVPKVISRSINDRATPTSFSPPFTFIDVEGDTATGDQIFYRKLVGFAVSDEDWDEDEADITFQNDGVNNIEVDVKLLGTSTLVGGGAEFGSGAEGSGVGLKGMRFLMNSTGQGPKNATTNIQARYLKVLGTAGG